MSVYDQDAPPHYHYEEEYERAICAVCKTVIWFVKNEWVHNDFRWSRNHHPRLKVS